MSRSEHHCLICNQIFPINDLFPSTLIHPNALKASLKKYPQLKNRGYLCYPDLRSIHVLRLKDAVLEDRGELSALDKEVLESIEHHEVITENVNEEYEEAITFGQRMADLLSSFGGSWKFIILFTSVILCWITINTVTYFMNNFDPYPFILLNLVLSCLAALQAPIIMMSQNRQSLKDRIRQENDYSVNLKAELQIRLLQSKVEFFMKQSWDKLHEIHEILEKTKESD